MIAIGERPLIWPMRAILYLGGVLVLVAGVQLWLLADRTDELFAWTINAEVTAAFIGSFYFSAAVLALLSAREQTWARARLGVPGVLAFVWLTLLATLLHLDLFHLDEGGTVARAAAWVWLIVYVVEPPALVWAFVAQRAAGVDPPRVDPLPGPYRTALGVQAAILLAFGAALFIAPVDAGELWPWELTELTARVIAAWLAGVGGLLAAIAWENERSRIRFGTYALVALVALQAVAIARFGGQVDWGGAAPILFVAFWLAVLCAGAYGWYLSTG